MQQIKPLTSLRFFAAAGVVIGHALAISHLPSVNGIYLGVSFFFVLSGFILTYAHADTSQKSARPFYVGRIARILPLYLLTLAACLILFPPNPIWPVTTGILNATLLQAWVPLFGVVFSYNVPAWSISAEAFFYILFPLFVGARHFWRWYAAALVATAVWLFIASYIPVPDKPVLGLPKTSHLAVQFPLVRLPEFLTGIAAARWFLRVRNVYTPKYPDAVVALLVASLALFIWSTGVAPKVFGYNVLVAWYANAGCQFIFAAIILVLAFQRGTIAAFLSRPWLVLLGEISFATYMVHHIIERYFIYSMRFSIPDLWVRFGISLVAVYAISYLVWRYIERPAQRAILSLYYVIRPHGETLKFVPAPAVLPGK